MRAKKAKLLRKVIRRQIEKQQPHTDFDLMETRYEKTEKFARQVPYINSKGKIETATIIYTMPIKLDFCFRRAYKSMKDVMKRSGNLKNVKLKKSYQKSKG